MSPTPPPTRGKTIAETHFGVDSEFIGLSDFIPANPEQPVSPVKKTKKYYTPDMQKKIAAEYQRSHNKAAIREKYDISQSAVCRWIKEGILGESGYLAESARKAERRAALTDERPLADLLWSVVASARAAGDISKEDARRLLELVL